MNVAIDPQRCVCSGYCARLAPTVFRLASPKPTEVAVASPPEALREAVREAAELCPTKAIKFIE
ncbi:MAG: ferredoxin [Proteobacteria bacterium]|nr:ferredoxin [Pseudomonadota bacterium]MBI3500134.1 ferredoxin [Pseudomonadota bacterium]